MPSQPMLVLAFFLAAPLLAQEAAPELPETDPAELTAPSDPATEEPTGEKLSIEEMKALSDEDLLHVYLDEPWRVPEEYGEDEELLDRVMRLAHPEMEEEAEPAPDAKPDPKPDVG